MQSFAGSSRLPKPQILKARTIDPYTGRTLQRARPLTLAEQGPPLQPPTPFGQLPMGGGVTDVRPLDDMGGMTRRFGMPRIAARAKGGPVKAGEPYLVGEKGPELMVPAQDGEVIAHAKLKKAMKQNRRKKPEKKLNPFYP